MVRRPAWHSMPLCRAVCVLVCSAMPPPLPSVMLTGRRKTPSQGHPGRDEAQVGGGIFLWPDCVTVVRNKTKGALPLVLVRLGHLDSLWARFYLILVPTQHGWSYKGKADQRLLDVCYAICAPDSWVLLFVLTILFFPKHFSRP